MTPPILFTRPDPTQFALLVVKTGRGTGTVVGTEHCKPGGTEWATDGDLWDAGYRPRDDVRRIAQNAQIELEHVLDVVLGEPDSEERARLKKTVKLAMLEIGKLLQNP